MTAIIDGPPLTRLSDPADIRAWLARLGELEGELGGDADHLRALKDERDRTLDLLSQSEKLHAFAEQLGKPAIMLTKAERDEALREGGVIS